MKRRKERRARQEQGGKKKQETCGKETINREVVEKRWRLLHAFDAERRVCVYECV